MTATTELPIQSWETDLDGRDWGYDRVGSAIACVRFNGKRTMASYRIQGLRRTGARVNVTNASWPGDRREEARAWCQWILTSHAGIV